ncbi:MAG: HAD-IIIA family hydrolase [Verrucomicrobia bacterium]|jgi:D-glycero-D-manno-heptose 1,7-bisphosphate phosphatase|nr:HAD-IIIA family hydrolase [Verrucomicrobiota bacterium]
MRVAAFIERDGLLNKVQVEHDCVITPTRLEDFKLAPGAEGLIGKLREAGYVVIATTNQPGLSTGDLSRRELDVMHDILLKKLNLDDIMVCPHDEADCCPCRKPRPGLLIEAGFKWHVDLDRSVAISDKWQDAEAARIAGCTSILIQSPWNGPVHHDFKVSSFQDAVTKAVALLDASGILVR